jgi:anti-anti-sigma regulatory factor
LAVRIQDASGLTVCALAGVVDDRAVPRLVDGLRTAFRVRPGAPVVLDLSGVAQLAPRAANAVIGAGRWARQRGGRLLVCGLSAQSCRTLDVGRLRRLSVFPDLVTATAAVVGARNDAAVTGEVVVGGGRR